MSETNNKLEIKKLSKRFGEKILFENLSLTAVSYTHLQLPGEGAAVAVEVVGQLDAGVGNGEGEAVVNLGLAEQVGAHLGPQALEQQQVYPEMCIRDSRTIVEDPEIGAIYKGKVTRLMNFGAFVEIAPGKEGLVHISKLDTKRVERVEDVVAVGDAIVVKVTDIDQQGRINLSRRDAILALEAKKAQQEQG